MPILVFSMIRAADWTALLAEAAAALIGPSHGGLFDMFSMSRVVLALDCYLHTVDSQLD